MHTSTFPTPRATQPAGITVSTTITAGGFQEQHSEVSSSRRR